MNSVLQELNEQYNNSQKTYSDNLRLKLHRSLSWLNQAEEQKENYDFCFISLWISFNAIYADDFGSLSDKSDVSKFLKKICLLDADKELYTLVWTTFSGNIRIFLNNKFIFQPFWDVNNNPSENKKRWQGPFELEKRRAFSAMATQNTSVILNIIFRRLYTLRNQILHGGASYNSSVNTNQKKEACSFLLNILPVIIKIIMNHSEEDWGKPYYPVIKE